MKRKGGVSEPDAKLLSDRFQQRFALGAGRGLGRFAWCADQPGYFVQRVAVQREPDTQMDRVAEIDRCLWRDIAKA